MASREQSISALRLPFDFDPVKLKRDLEVVESHEWVRHYNAADYEGDWDGVALRSSGGSTGQLLADPAQPQFSDTPLLERCIYFKEVLGCFQFPLRAVRLLRLRAGSVIREHSDPALSYEDGELRLHIPVQTNPGVRFYLDNRRVILNEGETWYLNLSRPHRIQNRGNADRVHLVIDGVVNDWVHAIFHAARKIAVDEPLLSAEVTEFDAFREIVFEDTDLQNRLLSTRERAEFIAATVEAGEERGFSFTADDVDAAIRAGKRAWIERWVDA